jgi:hypothetical protein
LRRGEGFVRCAEEVQDEVIFWGADMKITKGKDIEDGSSIRSMRIKPCKIRWFE